MAIVKKGDVSRPVRKEETVEIAELGGEVIVRQMTLPLYLSVVRAGSEKGDPQLSKVLSECVVDSDRFPIFSEEEWDAWGIQHLDASIRLYNRIRDLSGIDEGQAEKK